MFAPPVVLQAFWLSNWLAKGTRPTLQRLLLGENNISGIIFHEAGPPTVREGGRWW